MKKTSLIFFLPIFSSQICAPVKHFSVRKKPLLPRSSFSDEDTIIKIPLLKKFRENQFPDKFGFISYRRDSQLNFQREAESLHRRVAVLSIVILQFLDKVEQSILSIHQISSLSPTNQFGLLCLFSYLDFIRLQQFEDFQ